MNNLTAIAAFAGWAYNFDSSLSWIDEIQWSCSSDYIKEKFRKFYSYCGNAGVMVCFFQSLDDFNQKALVDWILKQYQENS